MFMVQSMDGKIQIFEQSANAFSRQLVDCLIPGPILYIPKTDAFVTVNHANQAECYRYQVLASSQSDIGAGSKETNDFKSTDKKSTNTSAFGLSTIRNALVEWSINLGESCRQIIEGSFTNIEPQNSKQPQSMNELLFICDKSLFLLKVESGGIIQQKRLERSDAACVCSYTVDVSHTAKYNNFILATEDNTVHVYSGIFSIYFLFEFIYYTIQILHSKKIFFLIFEKVNLYNIIF
jgi:hypothetical protein